MRLVNRPQRKGMSRLGGRAGLGAAALALVATLALVHLYAQVAPQLLASRSPCASCPPGLPALECGEPAWGAGATLRAWGYHGGAAGGVAAAQRKGRAAGCLWSCPFGGRGETKGRHVFFGHGGSAGGRGGGKLKLEHRMDGQSAAAHPSGCATSVQGVRLRSA